MLFEKESVMIWKEKLQIYEDIFVTPEKNLTFSTALDFCASCRSMKKVNRLMTGVFSFHMQYVINLKQAGRWWNGFSNVNNYITDSFLQLLPACHVSTQACFTYLNHSTELETIPLY